MKLTKAIEILSAASVAEMGRVAHQRMVQWQLENKDKLSDEALKIAEMNSIFFNMFSGKVEDIEKEALDLMTAVNILQEYEKEHENS